LGGKRGLGEEESLIYQALNGRSGKPLPLRKKKEGGVVLSSKQFLAAAEGGGEGGMTFFLFIFSKRKKKKGEGRKKSCNLISFLLFPVCQMGKKGEGNWTRPSFLLGNCPKEKKKKEEVHLQLHAQLDFSSGEEEKGKKPETDLLFRIRRKAEKKGEREGGEEEAESLLSFLHRFHRAGKRGKRGEDQTEDEYKQRDPHGLDRGKKKGKKGRLSARLWKM